MNHEHVRYIFNGVMIHELRTSIQQSFFHLIRLLVLGWPRSFRKKKSQNTVSTNLLWEKNTVLTKKNKLKNIDYQTNMAVLYKSWLRVLPMCWKCWSRNIPRIIHLPTLWFLRLEPTNRRPVHEVGGPCRPLQPWGPLPAALRYPVRWAVRVRRRVVHIRFIHIFVSIRSLINALVTIVDHDIHRYWNKFQAIRFAGLYRCWFVKKYRWLVCVREKYCFGWKFTIIYDKPQLNEQTVYRGLII